MFEIVLVSHINKLQWLKITSFSGRHRQNVVRYQFFARRFAPRPCLLLKFGHLIDIAYIYHVSKGGATLQLS